ncbi:MAG: DUF2892 domain-containing protein [Ignavibacteriota bacterium]|jgi:hypothetical protein|nr:MAG: DUF2892 domain-containing protein [Chlorobiota bacterium]MBE7475855.1 DUF2892 domain-containing protein [Ignavibacteriales bacterium]MBL1123337.1 DUF2892 domain-containing protein [Ignavibacteriota bacterium]MBV6420326.1 hypothetical protein [Ignavibacteriaceae bacterium]MCE7856538.1 DUF2892 domain-containing protein [Ignavibacteria bacterium CHB3]MEB2295467.1 DUF2892 domain-containing protein [Ignavibacteria bacterium]
MLNEEKSRFAGKKNLSSVDKGIRILLAVIIAILYFTNQITGTAVIVLAIFAVAFLLTGLTGFCPIYASLKLSTLKKSDKK